MKRFKRFKRFMSIVLAFALLVCSVPVSVSATSVGQQGDDSGISRYTVLVLETSSISTFIDAEGNTYTAGVDIDDIKKAASRFISGIRETSDDNYVAIVSYQDTAAILSDFSDDYDALEADINNLEAAGDTRNIAAGLEAADELLSAVTDKNALKNVVLFTTGLASDGDYDYSLHYMLGTIGSDWRRPDTGVNLFAYANKAFMRAQLLKIKGINIYSVCLLQDMEDMQERTRELAKFCELVASDLATSQNHCYMVKEPDRLEFVFGKVAAVINADKVYGQFRFASGSQRDYWADFYYDDAYFMNDASDYNASLATMSLCLALSAFGSNDTPDYREKSQNAQELLRVTGFSDIETNGYFKEKPSEDSMGVIVANKEISIGGEKYTLIALATRGGGYEAEWAGNFTVGASGRHTGFDTAAGEVERFLNEYIANHGGGFHDKVKIWLAGYSRAGATANLVAADLTAEGGIGSLALEKENIYAYCFEPPQGENTDNVSYEVAKSYTNIHNIVNRNDVVTKVAMKDWGFIRYGTDEENIPTRLTTSDSALFEAMLEKFIALQTEAVKECIAEDENGNKVHVIDTFQAKAISSQISVSGKSGFWKKIIGGVPSPFSIWFSNMDIPLIVDDDKPMAAFLDDLTIQLSRGFKNRKYYTERIQSAVRAVIATLEGRIYEESKWDKFEEIFYQKLSSEYSSIIYAYVFGGNEATIALTAKYMLDSMEEADIDAFSYRDALEEVRNAIVRTEYVSIFMNGGNDLITLIHNGSFLFTAHYPELCLAWLQMQDPNYTACGRRLFLIDSYRVIHINCPVDVDVYDSKGSLVARILCDIPQEVDDSHIVASFSSDGEKLVYLPADEDYSIKMTATGDGQLSYGVNEYSYETSSFAKIVNYYDIPIEKGDILMGTVAKFSEDDILNTGNGSGSGYELMHNNQPLSPSNILSGEAASNAAYLVTAQSDNRDGGAVIGGGVYAKGAYAQVTAVAFEKCSFIGWYIDDILVSTEESYRFRVESDVDLVAKFDGTRPTIGNGANELTIVAGKGGSIAAGENGYYASGAQAPIAAVPDEGYVFIHWTTSNGGSFEDADSAETIFTMPDGETVVTAVFEPDYIPCTHADTEIKKAREATCTEKGYTGDLVCKDCGEVLETGETINTIPHNYENGFCTVCGNKHAHIIENDACTICGLSTQEVFKQFPSDSTSIEIPVGVVSIPDKAFWNFNKLNKVVIPEGVVNIGNMAFNGCSSLSDITIPASVISIGDSAFYGCGLLNNIMIPDGVTSIGNYAFYGCASLSEINIPKNVTSIGSYAFGRCNSIKSIIIPDNVTKISECVFQGCVRLKAVYIPSSVTAISASSAANAPFYGCSAALRIYCNANTKPSGWGSYWNYYDKSKTLSVTYGMTEETYEDIHLLSQFPSDSTSIEIPDGVTAITNSAFKGYTSLTGITIPDSVTSIEDYAFSGCTSLENIVVPDGVVSIGNYAFNGCRSLTNITLPQGVESIGNYVFSDCTSLSSIAIPDSVESIGSYAFSNCQSLSSVIIPDKVGIIENSAFAGCTSLNSITIPESVTSIGNQAFNNCTSLSNIVIPDSITSIGSYAFSNCKSLTAFIIPDNVALIGNNAFQNCTGLKVIYIPSSVGIINASAVTSAPFYNCSSTLKIYCGANSKPSGWGTYWNYYATGKTLSATFGITREAFEDILILSRFPSDSTSIVIPYGVKVIPNSVFKGYASLASVTIPDSVTSIGDYAFSGCTSLGSITIPDSVISIGNSAFNGCASLADANIPEGMEKIGNDTFKGCIALNNISIPDGVTSIGNNAFSGCTSLADIALPDSLASIGSYAFSDCQSLSSIVIPDKVGKIESNVFSGCAALTNITIPDSVTSIGSYAFSGCKSLSSILIPDNVVTIGSCAFQSCKELKVIYIPAGVTSISGSAVTNASFYNCSPVLKIYCGAKTKPSSGWGKYWNYYATGKQLSTTFGITREAFEDILILSQFPSDSTSIEIPYGVKTIPDSAFKGYTSLVNITIPNSVISIGNYAFSGCTSLEKIIIPNSVTSIGNYVFNGCTLLADVTISESLAYIGNNMFDGCKSLNNITIPDGVTSIGNYAFSGCTSLTSIVLPDSLTSMGSYAFNNCQSLSSIAIPDKVGKIESYVFSGCAALTNLTIPDSVTSIGSCAFQSCKGLKVIYIPAGVTSISGSAVTNAPFYNCAPALKIYCGAKTNPSSGWGKYWNYWASNRALSVVYNGSKEEYNERLIFTRFPSDSTSIRIPDGVKEIPDSAFKDYAFLTSIIIPDSVVSIGNSAFYGCTSLTEVIIPDSVTKMGNSVFYGCTSLTDVTISNSMTSIGESVFSGCTSLNKINIPNGITSIGNSAFSNCTMLHSIVLPDSITTVGTYVFDNCTALNSVTISNDLKSLGSYMFKGCKSLNRIDIPDSVIVIGHGVFQGCTGLKKIYIPSSVTTISATSAVNAPFLGCDPALKIYCESNAIKSGWGTYWYYYAANLKLSVLLNVAVEEYGDILILSQLFSPDSTSIIIPDGIKTVPHSAFKDYTSLTNITIPASVTSIGAYAFSGCTSLKNINVPDGVTSIGTYAFSGCNSLKNIYMPDSVTSIGSYAFSGCTSLNNITIPACVTSIGGYAFSGCTSLNNIAIPASVATIGDYAFYNCTSFTRVIIPDSVTRMGYAAFSGCTSLSDVTIANGVTSIADSLFSGCTSLSSIIIPDSVTGIGSRAFAGCTSLENIKIPNQVSSIGSGAFMRCTKLKTIYIPSSVRIIRATSASNSPFYNCSSTLILYCGASAKQSGWDRYWAYYNDKNTLRVIYNVSMN